jgi:hypothetical protein
VIPVLQFDPASMTLWYDAHLLSQARGHRELELALEHAVVGDDRMLGHIVACTDDPWVQTRAANIASAVWHEKRHFLDFALTNYGALRLRSLFETYANLTAVLTQAGEGGRLLVPLDSNLDAMTCDLNGIGTLPPDVLAVARNVKQRKRMFQDDSKPVRTPFGHLEVGGEALLEAIAYHVQIAKAHRVFGRDLCARVQRDHPGEGVVGAKYKWAYNVMMRSGLLQATREGEDTLLINDGPFLPFCYGALAGRFWGQPQTAQHGVSSYLPGERFVSLATAMRERHPRFAQSDVHQAWAQVNDTCRAIFGRTVLEETAADIAQEQQFVERVQQSAPGSHVAMALADLHALRCRLYTLLDTDPAAVLDQARWADETVNRTQPWLVAAAPGGELGTPPAPHTTLSAYSHPAEGGQPHPEGRWWWSATNSAWPPPDAQAIALSARESWAYVAAEYAPLGKLLYAGNKMRVMLGNELFAARQRFQHATGFTLVVDPSFAWPDQRHQIDFWYFITGHDEFRCDLSGETVRRPEGIMLDPWELRLRPGLVRTLLGSVTDRQRQQLAVVRDWTPWLLSEAYRDFFESFARDEAQLQSALR